jgi:hypothetical protein
MPLANQAIDARTESTRILLGDKHPDTEQTGRSHKRNTTLQHGRAVIDMRHQFRLHIDDDKHRIRLHFP